MVIPGQKKSEIVLYAALWTVLFAAVAVGVYWDGQGPSSGAYGHSGYDWDDLYRSSIFLGQFCLCFFIHNFLLAPLLVYRNWRWTYGLGVVFLMAAFVGIMVMRTARDVGRDRRMDNRPRPALWDKRPQEARRGRHRMERDMPPPHKKGHHHMGDKDNQMLVRSFGGPPVVAFNIMLLLLALNVGTKYYFKSVDDRKRMKDLERDNLNRQLQYLKYQINPHFFMNTLNNIHALIDIDPEEAKLTIEVLSKLMRYVLYDADKPMAPLQKELGFLRHYVGLMRIRYTDRVHIDLSLPTSVPEVQVPSLLFATFVENAFKHGVSYRQESFIEVKAWVDEEGGFLHFSCRNSRKPEAEEKQGGVGLKNAVERLRLIYGNSYRLTTDTDADEYRLTLRLPIG